MGIAVERTAGTVVIVLGGDFDVQNAHEPYEVLAAAFEGPDPVTDVVIDMAAVEFIDSTGLGGLVRAKHEADQHAARTALRHPTQRVRSLLAMTGLDQEFHVEPAP